MKGKIIISLLLMLIFAGIGQLASAELIEATIDFDLKNNQLNLNSNGPFINVVIYGSADLEVKNIDTESLKIEYDGNDVGAEAGKSVITSINTDEYEDLQVKFDKLAVIDYLTENFPDVAPLPNCKNHYPIILSVTGIIDENTFEGSEEIILVQPANLMKP